MPDVVIDNGVRAPPAPTSEGKRACYSEPRGAERGDVKKRSFAAGVAITLVLPLHATAAVPKTRWLSARSNGDAANNLSEGAIDGISNDGRIAAFASLAQLVPGDNNVFRDIYVHNRSTGNLRRASVRSNETDVSGAAETPAVSGNGRFVAFRDEGSLVAKDDNGSQDIYVRDLKTGTTSMASLTNNGEVGTNSAFEQPAISRSGRFVAFATFAQLIGKDDNSVADVYVRDRKRDRTKLASQTTGGEVVTDSSSEFPAMSADGSLVVFQSQSDEFIQNDENFSRDIFLHNFDSGRTTRVSIKSNEEEELGENEHPSMSADGSLIAWESGGTLAPPDANNSIDIYLRNRVTGKTRLVSINKDGDYAEHNSKQPSISPNGRMVGFYSHADDLIANAPASGFSAYVFDRMRNKMLMVDRSSSDQQGAGDSRVSGMSGDGRFALINSISQLVGGDDNGMYDVYRRGPLY
jgi:Tol biopolymer transport system component